MTNDEYEKKLIGIVLGVVPMWQNSPTFALELGRAVERVVLEHSPAIKGMLEEIKRLREGVRCWERSHPATPEDQSAGTVY